MERDDDDLLSADTLPASGATPDDKSTIRLIGAAGSVPEAPGSAPRYELGALLGRGGMGEVVSARDHEIGRSVAIKRMHAIDPAPDMIARFLREARVQGRLDHPAVVPVHELRRDSKGLPFFVMKQLTGVTLDDIVRKLAAGDPEIQRKHTRQRLLRAFTDVCLAIEFAHTRGVVHRDLKPANIVIGDFGEVYVLDWGIAKVMSEIASPLSFADIDTLEGGETMAGSVLGTPGYMSPEQVHGQTDLDGRTDVYALGCILFEILALEPFHERGRAGLLAAALGIDARPSLRAPARDIPPELDAICVSATIPNAKDRLATARELGDAVQRFLDGDRDLALRKELARVELNTAREALARGNATSDRRSAMRAAARALALDPHATEPAELVGHLMLEPPTEVPAEVERELAELDNAALIAQGRMAGNAMLAYLVFFPLLYLVGFHHVWYLIAGPAVIGLTIVMARRMAPQPKIWAIAAIIAGNAIVIAMFARITSPFLIAPSLAVISVALFAMHPKLGPVWALASAMVAAVLAPWILELVGVVSKTMVFVDNHFLIMGEADWLDPTASTAGLVAYTLVIITMAASLSRSIANQRRSIQRILQIQSWQLRQLVPHGGE